MTMREGSGEKKLYLDVPFPDKEQVKALGVRWDRDARSIDWACSRSLLPIG
jgi:hypothetical protein